MKKLEERIEKSEAESKTISSNYAVEKERMETRAIEIERETREERERVEAEHGRQLTDLSRRHQDMVDVSTARLEQAVKEERERAEAEFANLSRHLQDVISVSTVDRATLEQEREQAEAERSRQLVDLTRRLQDEINVSAAYRMRLEGEIQGLLYHMTTAYVRGLFCLVVRND